MLADLIIRKNLQLNKLREDLHLKKFKYDIKKYPFYKYLSTLFGVNDLAEAHLRALEKLSQAKCEVINLGTGQGYSVLEIVKTFESESKCIINLIIIGRRKGDISSCYAEVSTAKKILN